MAAPSASVHSKKHWRLNEYFAVIELEQNPLIPAHDKYFGGGLELRSHHGNVGGTENVSSNNSSSCIHPMQTRYKARVTSRFPLRDHQDNHFPANLALFCLPGGALLSTEMSAPNFFVFVHTRGDGNKMYGYCLIFYEELEPRAKADLQCAIEEYGDHHQHDLSSNPVPKRVSKEPSLLKHRKESMYDLLGSSEYQLSSNTEVYTPKCLCLLSCWPHFKQYREWLTGLYRISLSNTSTPLERYICNFMLEVPIAQAGEVNVQYKMTEAITICFSCPPPTNPTAWPSLPFETLFKCLTIDNILDFFVAIVLERSVIIKSYHYCLLTACSEVVLALIFPLVWMHVYIPVLPESLLGVLGAPMPYLVGVHSSFLTTNDGKEVHGVPSHATIIDLDRNVVDFRDAPPLPNLPQKQRGELVDALLSVADFSKWHYPSPLRESMLSKSDLAFCLPTKPCDISSHSENNEIKEEPKWERATDAFLKLFVSLLEGYREWLVFPTEKNPSPNRLFLEKGFLEGKRSGSRHFIAALIDTQAFHNFVISRVHDPDGDDLDIILFDEAVKAKIHQPKKNRFRHRRSSQCTCQQANDSQSKTIVALMPDTSGLDELALQNSSRNSFSHYNKPSVDRFPDLKVERYALPRIVPSKRPIFRKFSSHSRRRRESYHHLFRCLLLRFRRSSHHESEEHYPPSLLPLASLDSTVLAIFMIGCMSAVVRVSERNDEMERQATACCRQPEKHSQERLDNPLSDGRITDKKLSTMGEISPGGPASTESEQNSSRVLCGGEERGGLLNASKLFCFAGTNMLYGSYCPLLMEHIKKGMMNREGKKQWDVSTTLREAVYECLGEQWGKSTSQEPLLSMLMYEPVRSSTCSSRGDNDLTCEELKEAAHGLLEMAFDILKFYRTKGVKVEKSVYLFIADATGRSGASEEAIAIAEMMMEDGILPEAAINRCLVEVCANDPDFDAMHAFDVLDWGKYRVPRNGNNTATISRGGDESSGDGMAAPMSMFLRFIGNRMHVQTSDLLLECIFPGLEIDADGETCPKCHYPMSCQEILNGWEQDVNVYTTKCPGNGQNAANNTLQQKTCGNKLVATFKVMCSDPDWIGSKGHMDLQFYARQHFVHSPIVLK